MEIFLLLGMLGVFFKMIICGLCLFIGDNILLYVVDGMFILLFIDLDIFNFVIGFDYVNCVVDIDLNDIESINILKG